MPRIRWTRSPQNSSSLSWNFIWFFMSALLPWLFTKTCNGAAWQWFWLWHKTRHPNENNRAEAKERERQREKNMWWRCGGGCVAHRSAYSCHITQLVFSAGCLFYGHRHTDPFSSFSPIWMPYQNRVQPKATKRSTIFPSLYSPPLIGI